MEQLSETYAIRALLRHYWKKGTNSDETVRQICAVEGPNFVDIETAHNWFSLFELGHTTLEPKKTIWLPSETWDVVFKLVPFSDLQQHIQMTCQRFWALSEPIFNRMCAHLVLYRQIPAEFMACPYVLRCPSIEIHWLEFEPISVLNWLKTSSGFAKKSLTIYGYYCDAVTTKPVNLVLATLISQYRGEPIVPVPEFVVDLCDFEDLYLAEFEDQHLALMRLSETNWRLISRTANAAENDQNREHEQNSGEGQAVEIGSEKTLIEIGRFFG
ncbi:hypothetical protein niasHS_017380 [Heterodera schachtii]|uniref:Mos1 transposase HTH domain-containing protein n=1 Tax=Heterodera schachtii TaxID=97005 RepID=A0ABD2HPE4_HETSC